MTLLLAVSYLQTPNRSMKSKKKVEEVLVNFALNMETVTKVFKTNEINKEEHSMLLFNISKNSLAIQLKNSKIFPVYKIEQTIEHSAGIIPLDSFTKGCLYNPVFEGFVIIEKKIYGIPDETFLSGNTMFQEVKWNQ